MACPKIFPNLIWVIFLAQRNPDGYNYLNFKVRPRNSEIPTHMPIHLILSLNYLRFLENIQAITIKITIIITNGIKIIE